MAKPTPHIQEQLKATGIAQVIVLLKDAAIRPVSKAGLELGAPVARGATESAISKLEKHFIVAPQSQDGFLARSLARRVVRSRRKTVLASTALEAAVAEQYTPPPKMRVFKHLGILLGTVDQDGLKELQENAGVQAVVGTPEMSLIRPVAEQAAKLSGDTTW